MKRKIAAVLAALSIFAAVPASATQVSDFVFNDEWLVSSATDDYYAIFDKVDDDYYVRGKTVAHLLQKDDQYVLDVQYEEEKMQYNIIDTGIGYYLLYAYDQSGNLYTLLTQEDKLQNGYRVYYGTGLAAMLLTDTKMITENGSMDCAIYGSNFYIMEGDSYRKSNIDILSDDMFMLKFKEPNSSENLLVLMVRSSVFDQ